MSYNKKLGQYFNLSGTFIVFKNIILGSKPDYRYKSIVDITENIIVDNNIKLLLIDKDNTITVPYEDRFYSLEIESKIKRFQEILGLDNVMIVSNSIGSSDDKIKTKEILGIKVLLHNSKKPNLKLNIKFKSNEVLIIGDRLFVDIYFAKNNNTMSILVNPLDKSKENIMVRLMRLIEDRI